MSNWDEQGGEIEVLESIYIHEGEFKVDKQDNPKSFTLNLVPYPELDCENFVSLALNVQYTADYPNSPPDYNLLKLKNFDDDMVAELKSKIDDIFAENSGMACMFLVGDAILEYLRENNRPLKSMHDKMLERLGENTGPAAPDRDFEESDSDILEEPEFLGLEMKKLCLPEERVTTKEFETWAKEFKIEMEEAGIWRAIVDHAKPTGRQQFERDRTLVDTEAILASISAPQLIPDKKAEEDEIALYFQNAALYEGDDDDEEFDLDELEDDDDE